MKDVEIIAFEDGPKAIYVSKDDPNFWQSGGIVDDDNTIINVQENNMSESIEDNVEEIVIDDSINDKLNDKTLTENLDSGIKIMGIGMAAVFGVLTILYLVIKIMGQFAKHKEGKDSNNEKN